MKNPSAVFAVIVLLCGAPSVFGEVADASAGGFTLKQTLQIRSTPQEVYRRLVHNVGDWWSSAHTFSGDSRNLSIDDKPMGCFCEKLPHNGGVRHMEVISVAPGARLRMAGGLGPLQAMATAGVMDIVLSPGTDGGTKLELTYAISGYLPKGLDKLAGIVDTVLNEQFNRLKQYVEHGVAGLPEPAAK
ncbi:MAG TPA: hypothetical protein VLT57_13800 [Bryobacteraceae bacterium]|nr:hypothetical protein [Bryobacteraceae bacterium]